MAFKTPLNSKWGKFDWNPIWDLRTQTNTISECQSSHSYPESRAEPNLWKHHFQWRSFRLHWTLIKPLVRRLICELHSSLKQAVNKWRAERQWREGKRKWNAIKINSNIDRYLRTHEKVLLSVWLNSDLESDLHSDLLLVSSLFD